MYVMMRRTLGPHLPIDPPPPLKRPKGGRTGQEGHVMLASLLAVLGVSVTGAALVNVAISETGYANGRESRRYLFEFSESCLDEAAAWLRASTRPPLTLPYAVSREGKDLFSQNENSRLKGKLSDYKMNCTINGAPATGKATVRNDARTSRDGESAADEGGYGLSGDLSPKVYYWLSSEGTGPANAKRASGALISGRF